MSLGPDASASSTQSASPPIDGRDVVPEIGSSCRRSSQRRSRSRSPIAVRSPGVAVGVDGYLIYPYCSRTGSFKEPPRRRTFESLVIPPSVSLAGRSSIWEGPAVGSVPRWRMGRRRPVRLCLTAIGPAPTSVHHLTSHHEIMPRRYRELVGCRRSWVTARPEQ